MGDHLSFALVLICDAHRLHGLHLDRTNGVREVPRLDDIVTPELLQTDLCSAVRCACIGHRFHRSLLQSLVLGLDLFNRFLRLLFQPLLGLCDHFRRRLRRRGLDASGDSFGDLSRLEGCGFGLFQIGRAHV